MECGGIAKQGHKTLVQRRMDDILWSLGKGDDADAVHVKSIRECEPKQAPLGNGQSQ